MNYPTWKAQTVAREAFVLYGNQTEVSVVASIVMYEIITSIRLHPFLLTAAEIQRLSDGEAREIDARIAGRLRKRIQKREASE